jgi:hypothetical protein
MDHRVLGFVPKTTACLHHGKGLTGGYNQKSYEFTKSANQSMMLSGQTRGRRFSARNALSTVHHDPFAPCPISQVHRPAPG